ncbi:MAG: nitrophenyl compound nitroreductase subunit ArsF family protein [Candidatus Aenigmatarchaeota archaeon]
MRIGQKTVIFALLFSVLLVSGCTKNESGSVSGSAAAGQHDEIEKLEVIHFHGTHQCYACITVGDYAEETVNTYFKDELKSGKISFRHVNGELSENYELVNKYGVTGASLWIGSYHKDGSFSAEQNINVWYKINNKQDYMNYLKSVIESKLQV